MILIWDNGQGYSDHIICFVDIGDADPSRVEALLAKHPPDCGSTPIVLGVVDAIAWRHPDSLMSLKTFADNRMESYSAHATDCPGDDGGPCACWVSELVALAKA